MPSNTIYTNAHPNTTIKGTGFKNAKKAKETIKIINQKLKNKNITLTRAKQIINILIQRAKYHPHKTTNMQSAINIFQKWMSKHQPS